MIVVAGTVRLTEAGLESIREVARETIRQTRQEKGCITYSFAADMAEPGLVRIYEEWESREALDAHSKTAHVARWREALSKVEVKGRDVKRGEIGSFEPLA